MKGNSKIDMLEAGAGGGNPFSRFLLIFLLAPKGSIILGPVLLKKYLPESAMNYITGLSPQVVGIFAFKLAISFAIFRVLQQMKDYFGIYKGFIQRNWNQKIQSPLTKGLKDCWNMCLITAFVFYVATSPKDLIFLSMMSFCGIGFNYYLFNKM